MRRRPAPPGVPLRGALAAAGLLTVLAAGCTGTDADPGGRAPTSAGDSDDSGGRAATSPVTPAASATPDTPATSSAETEVDPATALASDGRPRRAVLSVPSAGVRDLVVVPYRGRTDDAPGTEIQDGGVAASPHEPRGGTGPGGIGNYQVTAHRLSSTQAFLELDEVRRGDRVTVTVGRRTYVYEVRRTRITSFREPASLRAQRAAVPGRPGVEATRAMITLSTCRTPEDRAEGNDWSDRFGNPEHRIDKIGVLVAVRRA
ncbi:sortase domain-containing protein [Nocardioides bruguierae]|uniref:sortase domain-containing protein n=1 Tax=Nocardioides bruguierae TaxID=2945102 RepID=UPI002021CB22|nr:sortase [Nocardioides bruguierae]MCL8025936.1 sortase [Nocardioides bruguierae]